MLDDLLAGMPPSGFGGAHIWLLVRHYLFINSARLCTYVLCVSEMISDITHEVSSTFISNHPPNLPQPSLLSCNALTLAAKPHSQYVLPATPLMFMQLPACQFVEWVHAFEHNEITLPDEITAAQCALLIDFTCIWSFFTCQLIIPVSGTSSSPF